MSNLRKMIYPFLTLLMIVSIVSCGSNEEEKVKDVVTKFRTAVQELKFDEASKYCEENTGKMISSIGEMMAMVPENKKKEIKEEKFEISKVEFNNDTAYVYYWDGKTIDKNEEAEKMDLVKIDGDWKIYINKEDGEKSDKEGTDTDANSSEIEEDADAVAEEVEVEETSADAEEPM
jgi:hypothetical protein